MKIRPFAQYMEIKNIIEPRIPPYIWDILGYIGGLLCLLYFNHFEIVVYSCMFAIYGLLYIIVENYTVSFDYTNDIMPSYRELVYYKYFVTNKKYYLINKYWKV